MGSANSGSGKTNGASASGTQAIDRALEVLSSFVVEPEQGITELARRSELSPSTVHRIVRALVAAGYLEQNVETERYHLGHAALVLGQSAGESLGFERALPVLERLGGETGESVNMGVRDGNDVVVVLRVESVQPLRFDQPPGSRISLHCSSMGKSLLAFGKGGYSGLKLRPVTASTITTKAALERDLDFAREHGFATDSEESIEGVSCVAAPILNAEGIAVAAIALQAPTVRMPPERCDVLAKRVMAASEEIRETLGFRALGDLTDS